MGRGQGELTVRADTKKNRLYFILKGKITGSDLNRLYTDTRFCVADLKPSFDVITDLSACKVGLLEGVPVFRKIVNYLISNQVGSVVRVIDGESIVYKQVANLAYWLQGYRPVYVSSMEEAEKILDKAIERDGLRFCLLDKIVQFVFQERVADGRIVDISVSGCAIETATELPEAGSEVTVKIALVGTGDTPADFELKAEVVRCEEKRFAVSFTEPDEQYREKLFSCLIAESQR